MKNDIYEVLEEEEKEAQIYESYYFDGLWLLISLTALIYRKV